MIEEVLYAKRKAAALIKKWNDSKDKKCLVVQGARQTGKTYIMRAVC